MLPMLVVMTMMMLESLHDFDDFRAIALAPVRHASAFIARVDPQGCAPRAWKSTVGQRWRGLIGAYCACTFNLRCRAAMQ